MAGKKFAHGARNNINTQTTCGNRRRHGLVTIVFFREAVGKDDQ